jgi:hypothetical protein
MSLSSLRHRSKILDAPPSPSKYASDDPCCEVLRVQIAWGEPYSTEVEQSCCTGSSYLPVRGGSILLVTFRLRA